MNSVSTTGWDWKEQDTVIAALRRAVERTPDRDFLDIAGGVYTYRDIDLKTTRFANSLAGMGLQKGETLVTLLDNNLDAVVAWLAANKLCAISVPLNTALRGEFLRHQIDDAAAHIVICEADYLPRILDIQDDLPSVKRVLVRGDFTPVTSSRLEIAPLTDHLGSDETPIGIEPKPTDVAALIYTSGTTGPSKGCMLSFNYIVHLATLKLRYNPATQDDVVFTPLPLFHLNAVSTGITSTILVGGKIAIGQRFSVSKFWPEIERTGATIVSILGSMATLLSQAPDNDSMKACFGQVHTVRGNPVSPEAKEIWRTRFGAKRIGSMDFGLTEAAVITGVDGAVDAPPGSSGRRMAEFDVRIVDDDDRELPDGQAGEIIVRPLRPHIMFEGYWNRPADTMKVLRNLWFHTGDIGKFDENGFFYFVDRKKDYLRRRGENISSFEMEATFSSHPAVAEVAVHAVPSDVGEDDLKVTAILKPGAKVTEEELCRWCLDKVPYYAVPRYIEFRQEFPKNPQGRILKFKLREEGKTPATWDIEDSQIEVKKR